MMDIYRNAISCIVRDAIDFPIRKIGKSNILKPWMATKDEILILELLKNKKPKKCLEWGAGYSTIYFPKYLRVDSKWISIEHDEEWFERINQLIKDDNKIEFYHIHPNNSSWKDNSYSDGNILDFEDYVNFPKKFNKRFDFILIDGRARKFCLHSSINLLEPEGIVVLHDANVKECHEYFELFDHQILFTDDRHDSGGLWIGSKLAKLESLLDIKKHKMVWSILARFPEPLQWSLSYRLKKRK